MPEELQITYQQFKKDLNSCLQEDIGQGVTRLESGPEIKEFMASSQVIYSVHVQYRSHVHGGDPKILFVYIEFAESGSAHRRALRFSLDVGALRDQHHREDSFLFWHKGRSAVSGEATSLSDNSWYRISLGEAEFPSDPVAADAMLPVRGLPYLKLRNLTLDQSAPLGGPDKDTVKEFMRKHYDYDYFLHSSNIRYSPAVYYHDLVISSPRIFVCVFYSVSEYSSIPEKALRFSLDVVEDSGDASLSIKNFPGEAKNVLMYLKTFGANFWYQMSYDDCP